MLFSRAIPLSWLVRSSSPLLGFVISLILMEEKMEGLPQGYRPNVGICLINSQGQVTWQFEYKCFNLLFDKNPTYF